MTEPTSESDTDATLTMADLDQKFVAKEVCKLTKASVDTAIIDIGGMKEAMASMAKWMELHHETHTGGWKKAHTVAVIASAVIASISLACTSVLVILTILKYI